MSKSFDRPSEITTTDLNQSKYSFESLVVMRKEFPDLDDETLGRFLVARSGDVNKSIPMLKAHLEWRKTNIPMLKQTVGTEAEKGRLYYRGFDKEGHPVVIWNGKLHSSKHRNIDDMVKLMTFWVEYAISKLPPGKSKITVILNRIGSTAESSDLELAKKVVGLFSDNYPERLYTLIVYPSGIVFYGIWNIIKFFLDPVTQAKVKPMLSVAGVQEYVDNQYIPANMGGGDNYVFNFDDFDEAYPEDIIARALAKSSLDTTTIPESTTTDTDTTKVPTEAPSGTVEEEILLEGD